MRRILLVSFFVPSRKHAGGLRLLDIYSELRHIWPDIHMTLFACGNSDGGDGILIDAALEEIFDEIQIASSEDFSPKFLANIFFGAPDFDLVDLQYHQSGQLIGVCKTLWPSAVLIFSPMESQVRALSILISNGIKKLFLNFGITMGVFRSSMLELLYVWRADRIITVSDSDYSSLVWFSSRNKIFSLPTCISTLEFPLSDLKPLSADAPIVIFLAYFRSQTNREALSWFIQRVHPLILDAVPEYRFRVVGEGLSDEIVKSHAAIDVDFIGSVDSVMSELKGTAVGIAPALSGAGIRGKIHQYAALGIPCVASPVACESLAYQHTESIYVAKSPEEFAEVCISLLKNNTLRNRVGMNAHSICLSQYLWSKKREHLRAAYGIDFLTFGRN